MPSTPLSFRFRLSPWLRALLPVILVLIVYLPATHCGYIWDDDVYVTENDLLSAPDGLHRIWLTLDSPSQYFPLVYTTFRLEYALWGLHPAGYHWDNILLHAANALLVWWLLSRLKIPGAWLAAMIFALHPVQVESVAWITERKNVLMLFFFLLSLISWVDFTENESGKPAWRFYVLALIFHALALSAKTTACTLPAALLLILWLKHKPVNLRRLAFVVPFIALSLGMGLLTIWWERYHQGTQGKLFAFGFIERLLIASHAVWFYIGKLIWPVNLTFSYPLWKLHPWSPLAYGRLLAGLMLCWAIYCAREDFGRGVETAALFYVATLGPVLGFIMLYTFRYSFVADHYQYAACIGPVALFSAGAAKAEERFKHLRNAIRAVVAILLAALAVQTWNQCHVYRNNESIWRDTLAKNPDSLMAHYNLANLLTRRGNLTASLEHYTRAVEIDPTFPDARSNRGDNFAALGKLREATSDYFAAAQLDPGSIIIQERLGTSLQKLGRLDEAILHFELAAKTQPNSALAQKNLADALSMQGRLAEALPHYEKMAAQVPNAPQSHLLLGHAMAGLGKLDGAIAEYREALRLDPKSAEALTKLAWLLATTTDVRHRDAAGAVKLAEQACAITNRKNIVSLSTLAAAYAAGNRFSDAVAAMLEAQDLAEQTGQKQLAAELRQQMKLYQSGRSIGQPAAH